MPPAEPPKGEGAVARALLASLAPEQAALLGLLDGGERVLAWAPALPEIR